MIHSKKNNYTFLPAILLLTAVLVLGAGKLYVIANILFFIGCLLFYISNPSLLIFLFIVILPTNGFFSTENNLLGFFGPVTISEVFAFIVLLNNYVKVPLSKFTKISLLFIIALFTFNLIYDFRNAYFGIYDLNFDLAIKRLFKHFFRFGTLFLLVKSLDRKLFLNITFSAVHTGVILLILSSIFSNQLAQMGFQTTDASEELSSLLTIERKSGFFAFGDVNSLGGFLTCYFGFLLVWFSWTKRFWLFFILLIFTIIGILYTGSRTAIISLAFITLIYFFIRIPNRKFNQINKWKIILIVTSAFLFVAFFFQTDVSAVLFRFSESNSELDATFAGSRLYKWLFYLTYLIKTPESWLLGTREELWVQLGKEYWETRVPHNFYITIWFHSGIPLLIFFFYIWYKVINISIRYNTFILISLPIIAISFYVSDWGYFLYFVLFITLLGTFSSQISKTI